MSIKSRSSDAQAVRLRTKYNAALLRSRRLQKRISEDQRPAEALAVISHLRPRPDMTLTEEPRVGRNFGRSQHCVSASHMKSNDSTEACRLTLAKNSIGNNNATGSTVVPPVGIAAPPGMPKRSPPPACGNTSDVVKYATLPGKSGQRRTAHQHQPEVCDKPQHSGIPHTSGIPHASGSVAWSGDDRRYSEMSRATRRHDEMVLPLYNSLPRPKISWRVTQHLFVL